MEFPTNGVFNEYKAQRESTLKWRDVPTKAIYHIESIERISTKFGRSMVVSLVDRDGKTLMTFATSCLEKDLKDFSLKEKWFTRPLGE